MIRHNRSNMWKITLSLLVVALCVTLTVGAFAFAVGDDDNGAISYTVESVALKEDAQVYDDHTPTTIKDVLVVTGCVDGGDEQTLNPSQYSVTFGADKLTVGENTITVGEGSGAKTLTVNVIAAELLKTNIVATSEYQPSGSYFIDGDGYYAFVQGMSAEQVQSRLAVELVYTNHTEYKTFGDGVQWAISAPQEFGDAKNTNDANIELELAVDGIDDTVKGTVTFAPSKTVGLKLLNGWSQPENLTPTTTIQSFVGSLQGYVVAILNSGLVGDTINVENDLNYSGLYVGATAEALLNCSKGDIFYKTLEISSTDNNVAALRLENLKVTYAEFVRIGEDIQGDQLPPQVARSEKLDYGEFYINVYFKNERNTNTATRLYLKDIPEGDVTATYYDASNNAVSSLTRNVKVIVLDYKDGTATRELEGVQISPMTVSAPTIKDTELTYSDLGCSTEMVGLIEDDPAYGDDMIISAVSDGAEIQSDGKTIKFNHGGQFTVTVTFTNGSLSDFVFQQGSGNGVVDGTNPTIVTYTVNVLKAPITVSLNGFQTEYQYGDNEPDYSVNGKASDSMQFTAPKSNNTTGITLPLPANYVLPAENNKTNGAGGEPSFLLYYTGTQADGTAYESYDFPSKLRGSYKVHVITAETGWYDAGELETPFEFDIVERRLTLGDITIPSVKYQRDKTYTLDNILSTVTVGNLINPDDKNTVLEWNWATSGTSPKHADDYKINFKIKSNNYKWEGTENLTKEATFTIEALNLDMTLTLSGSSFVYGAVAPSPVLALTQDGSTVASFYAVVSDAKYYKVDGSNEILMSNTSFNTWDVGMYKVKYTTSVDTANGDVSGDYNLPTAEQTFTITPHVISQVKLDKTSDTYGGSGIDYAIVNNDGSALNDSALVNGQTYASILTVTKDSVLLTDGTTNVDARRMTIPTAADFNSNNITAIDAGNYTFKVVLNANYTWGGTANSDGLEEVTLSFVINQATVEIKWAKTASDTAADWNSNAINYTYDGNAHYPTLTAQNGLTLICNFTDSSSQTVTDSSIIDAGTYYVNVTSFTGDALSDASYTLAVNYVLPTTLQQSFVIASQDMEKPTLIVDDAVSGNAVTVAYNGVAVDFTAFINDYTNSYMLGTNPMLTITFDGNAQAPKNVKGTAAEEEYIVKITPAGNFKWKTYVTSETEEVTFTLKITRLSIVITWDDNSFNYVYNGNAQTVALNTNYALNNQQSDVIDVTFTYSGDNITSGQAINAGNYTVTPSGVTGAVANNYVIANANALSHALTIAKYSLAVPSIVGDDTVNFGVTSKSFALQNTSSVTDFDWDTAVSVSVAGQWKFNGTEYGAHPAGSAAFSFENSKLTFTHAGEYIVTFAIKDADGNYQWADGLTGAQTRTLTVNRQQVIAPALDTSTGTQRTIEYKADEGAQYPTGLTVDVTGLNLTFSYGNGTDYETVTSEAASSAYGLYFVKVTISDDNHLDYEWIENTSDKKNIGYVPIWGKTVYSADETCVYLHYMITKGILYVDYTVTNYAFGDNGYNGTYGHAIDGKTDPLLWGGDDKETIINNGGTENFVFYKFTSQAPTSKPGDSNLGTVYPVYSDLVNGLPWEAGYYGVLVTIMFPSDSQFETITAWYAFEVEKREITVNWSGETTVVYDGQSHVLVATVTNEIFKNGGADADKIVVPEIIVALNANGDLPLNASATAYTLNAYIDTTSDNSDNFRLPASGLSNTLTIQKRTVKLNVADGTYSSVYGNDLTHASATWNYITNCSEDNKFVEDDTTSYITYKLYAIGSGDTLGSVITSTTPNAGSYWLVPELTTEAQGNYILECDYTSVKYTVEQRAITIVLTNKATSVYGQNIAVYKEGENGVYTVDWTNGTGEWWVGSGNKDVKTVFTLTTTATNTSIVGSYPVTLTVMDGVNYAITADGSVVTTSAKLGDWTITHATISAASVAQNDTPTYDGQGHTIVGELVDAKVTLVNHSANVSSVKWFYTTASLDEINADTAVWTEVTTLKQIDAINQNYYFKVTADNHNDKLVGACDVVINKAQLKVSINLAIWYGEQDPAELSGGAYKATIAELLKANTAEAMYSVDGFKTRGGVLETILDIIDENSGTFTYTTTYKQGDNVNGTYNITFVNIDLTATNYEFVNDDTIKGVLTVKKLMLDVVIKDISNVYYDTYDMVAFVTEVTLPNSTYTGETLTADELYGSIHSDIYATTNAYCGANVITLTTAAFADNPTSATYSNPVGDYIINGTVTDSNYDATFNGETEGVTPTHVINPATIVIDEENIDGYDAKYNEQWNNALVLKVTGKNSVSDYVTVKGGMSITVLYYAVDSALSDEQLKELDWSTVSNSQMPRYIDVCNKVVYVLIHADNHDDVCLYRNVQITKGENSFTNEEQLVINNWTYGLYASDNENGYKATSVEPTVAFDSVKEADHKNNTLKVALTRNGNAIEGLTGTYNTISGLFKFMWDNGLFDVGSYVLTVTMDETDNYGALEKEITFTVNAKELTITANNQSVVYGNDFANYTYVVTGYAVIKTDGTKETATIAFAGMNTDFFTTAYVKGRAQGSVGKYDITTIADNAIAAKGNYTFTYVTDSKALTVTPCEVTINIVDHTSQYNGATDELNYLVVDGAFYSEDNDIIVLRTLAIAGYGLKAEDLSATTNNVIVATRNSYGQPSTLASYPIYVVYGNDAKGADKTDYNYTIKFSGCSYTGALENYNSPCDEGKTIKIIVDGDTPIVGGAASYKIERAMLGITYDGVYHKVGEDEVSGTVYSGAVNYYKATPDDGSVQMTFSYGYNKNAANNYVDIDAEQVKNVGYYIAYGRLTSDNYYDASANQKFEITPATITLTANDSTVQYGTTLSGNPTDNNDRFVYGGYEYDKGTLLQSVYDAYIASHKVTYKVDRYTAKMPVGSDYITPVCANDENGNILVVTENGKLTIVKRNITVTVKGINEGNTLAQCDYLGTYAATQAKLKSIYEANWAAFISVDDIGDAGDTLDKLAITFTLPSSAVNANSNGYRMSVSSGSNTNYNITFKTSEERTAATISYNDEDAPRFVINKAKLTIYAHLNSEGSYTVTYGNKLSYNDLNNSNSINYSVVGMQNNESFRNLINVEPTYSVLYGTKEYTAWESNVGETYTVSVSFDDGLLANYELDASNGTTYVTTTLTINKRVIAASTENQEFEWDKVDYHNGIYGKAHEAVWTFADNTFVSNEANELINGARIPTGYSVAYSTQSNSAYNQAKGAAPTVVGEYTVTLTLATSGNYTFADGLSVTKEFNITQRVIREGDLTWDPTSLLVEGEDKSGSFTMENYINSIMDVRMFTYYPNGQSGSTELYQGEAGDINAYYFDGQTLKISAEGRGRYEVIIQLKDSATHNYVILGSNGALAYSSFVITSTSVNLTLTIDDWTYNTTPNMPDAKLNGDDNESIVIHYRRVDDANVDAFYGNGADNKGALSSIDGLNLSGGWISSLNALTFNAGYYVVRAQYTGSVPGADGQETAVSAVLYYVFKVDTAKVSLPTADKDGYIYNGAEQSLIINYATSLVRASYNGHTGTAEDGMVAYATNANTYEVTFTLIDINNYEWENGGTSAYTLSWTIANDKTANGQPNDSILSADEQTDKEYGDVSINGETIKAGYNGRIERLYVDATGRDFGAITEWANDVEWTSGLPEDVGNYYVRLVLKGNSNFTDKVTYVKLSVMPKEVIVTASGSVTYGDDWATKGVIGYEGTGLYGHKVTGTATFVLVENYGTLQAGGEYYIVVESENGKAKGLTMSDDKGNDVGYNYVIRAAQGRLIVNQRPVTVTLGNLSAQYGEDKFIDPATVKVTVGANQLIVGDDLGLEITSEATATSSVGGYVIRATANNNNYSVAVVNGIYTITERRIRIEIEAINGIYMQSKAQVTIKKVIDDDSINDEDITDLVKAKGLVLSLNYKGTVNKNNASYNSNVVPTEAGSYTATVFGSDNNNFIIVGEPFITFVVDKMEIDSSLITIANQTYTGQALIPVIDNAAFATEYAELIKKYENGIYEVLEYGSFVNAGPHAVTLRINDFDNLKWKSVDVADRELIFTVDKANNSLTSDIVISGWTYGDYDAQTNLPSATVKFGQSDIAFVYSNMIDGTYTSGVPSTGDVGEYWVKVTVPASDNYNAYTSEPVKFAITKKALVQPTLTIVTEGEGKNDVYTGEQLTTAINGYDMALMNLVYDDININNGQIIARATNAGTYVIKLSIANTKNYCWQGQDNNEITLTWTIAPKAIAKPTANTDRFIVNGQILTYIPVGFDEQTMTISGNEMAYGGEFDVIIGLKDKANYVWAEGGTDDFTLVWNVVGINTVFTIVVSVLGGASGVALVAIGIQLLLDRRRKRLIDLAIDARSQAEAWETPTKTQTDKTNEGGNN